MSNFSLKHLAESTQARNMGAEAARITSKWEETGLLEGLGKLQKEKMAKLLENQAAELIRGVSSGLLNESNSLSTGGAGLVSSGQIAGFTNVAFPIVRKVFGGLIANEIVSVQPMSLPAGLLFYLDYTYGSNVGGDAGTAANQYSTTSTTANETYTRGQSIYANPVGANIRSGSTATGGQYDLVGSGYNRVHVKSLALQTNPDSVGAWTTSSVWSAASTVGTSALFTGYNARFVGYDPAVENAVANNDLDYCFAFVSCSEFTSNITGCDLNAVEQIMVSGLGGTPGGATTWGSNFQGGTGAINLRKLNERGNWNPSTGIFTKDPIGGTHIKLVFAVSNTGAAPTLNSTVTNRITCSAVIADSLSVNSDGSALVIPSFETDFAVDSSPRIPEVDIKIESVAVTATSRKLRAKWAPEMAQDLTAFYSIDIEQELTNLLSEMVTLDIDREILNNLLTQASAANYYWSRTPGQFVNKVTGAETLRSSSLAAGPAFTGDVQQWYQTLLETISDVANVIFKKTLRGQANFIVTSTEIATIFQHTGTYKASVKIDSNGQVSDGMTVGAESVGTLNSRYVVHIDPYFPANKILIGLKGSTFLESGYIYAPYIPLVLTPVVYGQEDFSPRRGISTRYGQKMVRADFYGSVTVLSLNTI